MALWIFFKDLLTLNFLWILAFFFMYVLRVYVFSAHWGQKSISNPHELELPVLIWVIGIIVCMRVYHVHGQFSVCLDSIISFETCTCDAVNHTLNFNSPHSLLASLYLHYSLPSRDSLITHHIFFRNCYIQDVLKE